RSRSSIITNSPGPPTMENPSYDDASQTAFRKDKRRGVKTEASNEQLLLTKQQSFDDLGLLEPSSRYSAHQLSGDQRFVLTNDSTISFTAATHRRAVIFSGNIGCGSEWRSLPPRH